MTEHARDAEAIFLAALDKTTPQERVAYVEATCVGDPELLRRVRELLSCHEGSQGLLDAPPPGLGGTVDLSEVSEQPGTVIGPYKLLQQIGEGGMGTVYMAEQTQPGPAQGRPQGHQAGHGQPAGHRPLRGRAAGPGHDGPSQHRHGPRRRRHRVRPALLRHGAGQGRADHQVLRRATA